MFNPATTFRFNTEETKNGLKAFNLMSHILFVSSEAFPLIKTGGLADVAGSLPVALHHKKQDVRLCLPAYTGVVEKLKQSKVVATGQYYHLPVNIIEGRLPGSLVRVWLIQCDALFLRPGGPYSDQHGHAWHDNALRFALFCRVANDIALNRLGLNWQADLIHCNDWQSGLIPALLSLEKKRPATIFTIHNLAYQGLFSYQTFNDLQLPPQLWNMDGLEFHGEMSFIKGGLAYADKITTVSQGYAKEIRTAQQGYGLEGLLQYRAKDLLGILNGIDDKVWNPGTDDYLVQKYNRRSLDKKSINKTALQQEYEFTEDANCPMIGMVSRLVEQKGLNIILDSLAKLLKLNCQIIILGTGDTHYEILLAEWAEKYPDKLKVVIGYNESLAHRIEAASDLYMMPSVFEPCGLNQLYSLRYATLPIVTAVGGLADTVIDSGPIKTLLEQIKQKKSNGFVLSEHSAKALLSCVDRALGFYQSKQKWAQLQLNALNSQHTWQSSAEQYIQLYQQLTAAKPGRIKKPVNYS